MERNKKMKICFAASSGGHYEQLMMLKPLMEKYDSFVITERTDYSAESKGEKTYYMKQVNRREKDFIWRMIQNAWKSVEIYRIEKPDVVICTGVLAMIPICLISKLMGKKLIYIESFAKVTSPTETGKLLYKSKKNNNDRTQYRQKNHHEAIVSREVFNAANHLRASRNYSKKDRPLPVLSVVEDGILRGYVPFDKDWTGFSAEEYREASESVMKEPDVTVTADVKKRLDLTGYEIVRVQYFSTMQNPAMTISNGRLRFNTACLKKFENVEYVELLLNSVERCIAIRPCDKNNPNAIRWGRLKEGRWCASTLGCRGLAKTLFDIMEWDEDLRYRFRGQFLEQGDNKMMLFAFDEPEMIKVEEIVLPPKENTEEDEGETVKKKIYIFPPEWAGTFGQPITSIAQVGILRQEHYAGNWDVFRPATEIEEMNIFTAESLNELLREAEKIMEGWTDYR